MRTLFLLALALWSLSVQAAPPSDAANSKFPSKPKLILVLVFDQFRSDYLTRFESRFSQGGFKYLMREGAYFPYAEYDLLQAMTGPGHATVLTGAYPYQMGIPLNDWLNRETGEKMYCAEDPDHITVGTQSAKSHSGTSPKNLVGTTFGDELKNAGYPSRVVSIALKDRSAIFMGGHRADIAVWIDSKSGRWVSSSYYLKDKKLPTWLENANHEVMGPLKGKKYEFKAEGKGTGLSLPDAMAVKTQWTEKLGLQFPHIVNADEAPAMSLPKGLEVTAALAEHAMRGMNLGRGKATDVLAVSFSSHDYLAHGFGPNSREMEEMTVAGDRVVAKLLDSVRKYVPGGLSEVTVVLTADHGGPYNPDWLKTVSIPAGRISDKQVRGLLEAHLAGKFGKPKVGDSWVRYGVDLNYFLNREAIIEADLEPKVVEDEARSVLLKQEGAAHVFTRTDLRERKLPGGSWERRILKTYFDGRNGDVIIIPKPNYMDEGDTVAHLTPYSYDRIVPILFAGKGIRRGVNSTRAEVIDIAPTLSWLTGTVPPSGSEGRILTEALR